jgi:hypothetical protein
VRLPQEQSRRVLVLALVYAALGGGGAVLLVWLNGPYLGGLLAVMWLELLAVPSAVLAFGRRDRSSPSCQGSAVGRAHVPPRAA